MANSAFNISGCGTTGGSGGSAGSGCGWGIIVDSDDGNHIETEHGNAIVITKDAIRNELRSILASTPDLMGDPLSANRVADWVTLKYECPKSGDAVFWNSSKHGYDLASAELDNAHLADPEHLIESLGIVEHVRPICAGGSVELAPDYEARVVFFGKITFPETTSTLAAGMVYYLADTRVIATDNELRVGNNSTNFEPVISKPLFVATGEKTAIVTNYRPLTGSPTGGIPATEEYTMSILPKEFASDGGIGWEIEVINVGTVSSRSPLFIQFEYDKLEGPQQVNTSSFQVEDKYISFLDIGVLYTQGQEQAAAEQVDGQLVLNPSYKSSVKVQFATHNKSGATNADSFGWSTPIEMTGVGELMSRLKIFTQDPSNVNAQDRYAQPEVALQNSDDHAPSRIVPTLSITASCTDKADVTNKLISSTELRGDASAPQEGAVFEIHLAESTPTENASFIVPMPADMKFIIEQISDDANWTNIVGDFKLPAENNQTNVELIPMIDHDSDGLSDASTPQIGIIDRDISIRLVSDATTTDISELHETHWAYPYATQIVITCGAEDCCLDTQHKILPNSGEQVSITDILTDGDSAVINNLLGAKFFTKAAASESHAGTYATENSLLVSYKNMRENTSFCYPNVVRGTEPSFMTIYAKEARILPSGHDPEGTGHSQSYDPRYTIIEIGAQDVLNGEKVKLVINQNVPDGSTVCYEFEFDGSVGGSHFTLEELELLQGTTKYYPGTT